MKIFIDYCLLLLVLHTCDLQVKYTLDPAHMRPGEGRLFTKYLSQQSLHIDVWDGDSLLLIGSCCVDLKVCLLSFVICSVYFLFVLSALSSIN